MKGRSGGGGTGGGDFALAISADQAAHVRIYFLYAVIMTKGAISIVCANGNSDSNSIAVAAVCICAKPLS